MFGFAVLTAMKSFERAPTASLQFSRADELVLSLDGKAILDVHVQGLHGKTLRDSVKLVSEVEPATPMFLGYPHGPKTADWTPDGAVKRTWRLVFADPHLTLTGTVSAGKDARPCTSSLNAPLAATYGPAVAGFDNAVYDRGNDWLLETRGSFERTSAGFAFHAAAPEIILKTDYYRDHRGYFLWDRSRQLWGKPVAGWCSWAAYGQGVTQKDVESAAQFFSKNLKAYGFGVIQIDDGYQRVLQITDNHQPITEPFSNYWTKPNEKFPDGMGRLASSISSLGMTPGIWAGLYLPLGLNHKDGYVTDASGSPLQGPWVGYSMDSGNPAAVAEAYTDTLRTFREQGWRYFKIDTLRHVLYDSYRRVPAYWAERHTDSSTAYRKLFTDVRDAVGKSNYLLACWGALPELAGLPDGCRIGEDVGPSFESMRKSAKYIAQFHYANDVIWRNDPDYMCLRVPVEQCQTWATLTSLTGEHVMVSDPIDTYDADRVDVLRRVGPPVVTNPANVTPLAPDPEWITLAAAQGSETWTVAARMAWSPVDAVRKPLGDLGLDPSKEYLAFDFWKSKFLGVVSGSASFDALDQGHCEVVSFRPLAGVPQVLGDDRHLSQGAYELEGVKWHDGELSGRFNATPGRDWNLYVYVPDGYEAAPQLHGVLVEPHVLKISFQDGPGWMDWSVRFRHQ